VTDSAHPGHSVRMLAVAPYPAEHDDMADPAPAIDDIFQEHADFVWRALRRAGLSASDAEDALQDVFLVVHRRLTEYEERGLMRAWLLSISRQVAGHHRRSANRHLRKAAALAETHPASDSLGDGSERLEAVAFVRAFLAQLDPGQADVFSLVELEEMTAPEVAAVLGVKLNTVYSRLRLARKRFEELARADLKAGEQR
jgi:RNA polymerase sigma-70 factor (ECF subfamily)